MLDGMYMVEPVLQYNDKENENINMDLKLHRTETRAVVACGFRMNGCEAVFSFGFSVEK